MLEPHDALVLMKLNSSALRAARVPSSLIKSALGGGRSCLRVTWVSALGAQENTGVNTALIGLKRCKLLRCDENCT